MTQELPFANRLQVPFIFIVYYATGGFCARRILNGVSQRSHVD